MKGSNAVSKRGGSSPIVFICHSPGSKSSCRRSNSTPSTVPCRETPQISDSARRLLKSSSSIAIEVLVQTGIKIAQVKRLVSRLFRPDTILTDRNAVAHIDDEDIRRTRRLIALYRHELS